MFNNFGEKNVARTFPVLIDIVLYRFINESYALASMILYTN
jgi:hypothetical protein